MAKVNPTLDIASPANKIKVARNLINAVVNVAGVKMKYKNNIRIAM